jgi:hypothetical protein
MKSVMASILILGISLLGCSSTSPVPTGPTPNIEATVEARAKELVAAQASATPTPEEVASPSPAPTYPEPTPVVDSTAEANANFQEFLKNHVGPAPTPCPKGYIRQRVSETENACFAYSISTATPTPHPWGRSVTYFDNTVYFLSPVTESIAEKYLEYLENGQFITADTDKRYQLRLVDGVYEIRNGIYKTPELRYLSSDEFQEWLFYYRASSEAQRSSEENMCTIQEGIFEGVAAVRRWIQNPADGFDNVVDSVACPPAGPTPTPPPSIGTTRANPISAGRSMDTFDGLALTVFGFDSDASDLIHSFSNGWELPESGNRFVMVGIRVQAVDGFFDSAMSVDRYDFYMLGSSGRLFDAFGGCTTFSDPLDASLFQGAVYEGNLCFEIPVDESDLLVRYKGDRYDDGVAWFEIAQPSLIESLQVVPKTLILDKSKALGTSRSNPFQPNDTWLTPNGLEIAVESINLDAWNVVLAENQFNDPPAGGNRHLMINLNVSNKSGGPTPIDVSQYDFHIVGSTGLYRGQGSQRCGVIPNPVGATLYSGGALQGNICFEVGETETEFILSYGRATWVSLGSSGNK